MGSAIERKFEYIVKNLKNYTPPINEDDWQAMERHLNANPKAYSGKDRSTLIGILIGILLLIVALFIFRDSLFSSRQESSTVSDKDTSNTLSVSSDSTPNKQFDSNFQVTEATDTLPKDTSSVLPPEPEETKPIQVTVKKPRKRKSQSSDSSSTPSNNKAENKTGEEYDFTKDQQDGKPVPAVDPQTEDSNKSKKKRRSFFKKKSQEDDSDSSPPE